MEKMTDGGTNRCLLTFYFSRSISSSMYTHPRTPLHCNVESSYDSSEKALSSAMTSSKACLAKWHARSDGVEHGKVEYETDTDGVQLGELSDGGVRGGLVGLERGVGGVFPLVTTRRGNGGGSWPEGSVWRGFMHA